MKEDHIEKDVPEVEVETIFSVYPSAENIYFLKMVLIIIKSIYYLKIMFYL